MSYRNEKLVSDDGPSKGGDRPTRGDPSYQVWRDIRERSVLGFVNDVSKALGAPADRGLRQELYEVVAANGLAFVRWEGTKYTGPMLLDLYRRSWREHETQEPQEVFGSKAQWDGFQEAMRVVRDPNVTLFGTLPLRKIGEAIEQRQRPHAERNGWVKPD